jgi:hypothetical protein
MAKMFTFQKKDRSRFFSNEISADEAFCGTYLQFGPVVPAGSPP